MDAVTHIMIGFGIGFICTISVFELSKKEETKCNTKYTVKPEK